MSQTISILGLGWLGLPLAKSFLQKGYLVKGSVTSDDKLKEMSNNGIAVSQILLNEKSILVGNENFFQTDILFINIPPRRILGIELAYPNQVKQLLPYIQQYKIKKVIFISSTSVYPEANKTVRENENLRPDKGSGIACLQAEDVLLSETEFKTTVVRFGGLIGADRNPLRFMKRGIKNGPAAKPINLIHLDDCIGIIHHIVTNEIWEEVINGTCPIHPTREEFYVEAAKIAGVEPPLFDKYSSFKFKTVSSEKLTSNLGYTFRYKSPIDYLKNKGK
ncbi:MAG: hypothetical protein PF541_08325 [Prolixibacteraceae bacterium]|jgi:nucleoside-diphosphate-sugar epimerase|nr:hypothetical protein [Prolixibacteraceae bacterium]